MGKLVDSTIMHDPHLEFTRELAWLVYKRLIKICMVGAASGEQTWYYDNKAPNTTMYCETLTSIKECPGSSSQPLVAILGARNSIDDEAVR